MTLGLDSGFVGFWLPILCRAGSFAEDLEFVLAAPAGSYDDHLPAVVEHHVVTWLQQFETWRRSWHEVFAGCCVPKQHYGDVGHRHLRKMSVRCWSDRGRRWCAKCYCSLRTRRWLGRDVLWEQKPAGSFCLRRVRRGPGRGTCFYRDETVPESVTPWGSGAIPEPQAGLFTSTTMLRGFTRYDWSVNAFSLPGSAMSDGLGNDVSTAVAH